MVTPCANGWHHENCDRLTAAIEQDRRETLQAAGEVVLKLLSDDGDLADPADAVLKVALTGIGALAHPKGPA